MAVSTRLRGFPCGKILRGCVAPAMGAALAATVAVSDARASGAYDDPSAPVEVPEVSVVGQNEKMAAASVGDGSLPGRGQDPSFPVGAPELRGGTQEQKLAALSPQKLTSECLPRDLKLKLRQIESRWGSVRLISVHRPGARVKGSGRPSRHASCRAVDFHPPKGSYREVARWLKENHQGGVGTYSGRLSHIHIDDGPPYRWHN